MTKSINVKIDENMYDSMTKHEEVNWSGVVRTAIKNKLEQLETKKFDKELAMKAFKHLEKIRESRIFSGGKSGTELIREWRDKRR